MSPGVRLGNFFLYFGLLGMGTAFVVYNGGQDGSLFLLVGGISTLAALFMRQRFAPPKPPPPPPKPKGQLPKLGLPKLHNPFRRKAAAPPAGGKPPANAPSGGGAGAKPPPQKKK